MAKSSSTYRKKNESNLLMYIVIGFAIAFFAILVSLIFYNVTNQDPKYDDFTHLDSFSQMLSMPEEDYLLYYYSESCSFCNLIKPMMLEFASSNVNDVKVYFMDAASIQGTNPISQMTGTPSLVVVENGQITDLVVGSDNITELIDNINDGTYVVE